MARKKPVEPPPATDHPSQGRLEGLRWLREALVKDVEAQECCVCEKPRPSQLAPLAGRLADVLQQIDELERALQVRGSKVDELADKRKTRRAGAQGMRDTPRDRVDGGVGSG